MPTDTGNCNRDKNTESQKMSTGNFYDWRHQRLKKQI